MKRYCSKFVVTSAFISLQREKSYEDIYNSPPDVFVITGNILIAITRFAYHHFLLDFKSTFMTYYMYLGTIQICQNLNEHSYYLISTTSVDWQIDANFSPFQSLDMLPFHIRFGTLKTNLIGLISYFLNITLKQAQFTSFSYLHMYEWMVWQPTENLQSSFY